MRVLTTCLLASGRFHKLPTTKFVSHSQIPHGMRMRNETNLTNIYYSTIVRDVHVYMWFMHRPEPDQKGEGKAKRKRQGQDEEDTENSTTLANTPSPIISGCHGDGGRRPPSPKNGQYRNSNSGRPKRRRLSHSSYSITIDEDPLDADLPTSSSSSSAKVTIVVVQPLNFVGMQQ